jgi:hypothetical protein
MAHSVDELIHNFNDDDDISELYFVALTALATEFECSIDDAHHGVVDMFYEMQKFEVNKESEIETRH